MIFGKRPKKNRNRSLTMFDNLFKAVSKKADDECLRLTKLCFQKCTFDRLESGDIIKYSNDMGILQWESIIYTYLSDKQMVPDVIVGDTKVCYKTGDKISVYEYLKTCKQIKLLLNELFGFVCKFREYDFLHGNLHVHNVFVHPDTFYQKGRFYIIDYSNSFLLDNSNCEKKFPRYQRSSFLGDFDRKVYTTFFEYWDFFTLYISLRDILQGDSLDYLNSLILYYIKTDIFDRFLHEYQSYNNTNILTFHLDSPNFLDNK